MYCLTRVLRMSCMFNALLLSSLASSSLTFPLSSSHTSFLVPNVITFRDKVHALSTLYRLSRTQPMQFKSFVILVRHRVASEAKEKFEYAVC